MNKLKDLSLRLKQLIVIIIYIVMTVSAFLTFYYIYTLQMHYSDRMQMAERHVNFIELIASYAHDQASEKTQMKQMVDLFNHSLQVLKSGGTVADFHHTFTISATNDESELIMIEELINRLAAFSQPLKKSQQMGSGQEQPILLNSLKSQSHVLLDYYQQRQEQLKQFNL